MKHPQRRLAFIDTETTGLDPATHEVIEVGIIVTNPTGHDVLDRYTARMMPERLALADVEALRVNKFDQAEWSRTAQPRDIVARDVALRLQNVMFVAQNAAFDVSFLTPFLKQHGVAKMPWHYHLIDTACLAWPLMVQEVVTGTSLMKLCEHFNIPYTNAHSADVDAELCRQVYLKLMRWHET